MSPQFRKALSVEAISVIEGGAQVTAVSRSEPASAQSTVFREDAAMDQDGHARMAIAETSRNSFSVAPLAA